MRGLHAIALLIVFSLSTGCVGINMRPDLPYRAISKLKTAVKPPPGLLYSKYKAPLVFRPQISAIGDFKPITFGSKVGTSTAISIGLPPLPFPGLALGVELFSWGDASGEAAAKSAGIQEVDHSDYQFEVYLAIFRRVTIEVYGD
jgi:hypothetical protein